jgi:hypothetical protein
VVISQYFSSHHSTAFDVIAVASAFPIDKWDARSFEVVAKRVLSAQKWLY